jgi:transposase-like protein
VTLRRVLVELTMREQRFRAVLEVQAGVPVTEVAERFGVSRQAVHRRLGWYRDEGLERVGGHGGAIHGPVRFRLHPMSRRRSANCAGRTRGGGPPHRVRVGPHRMPRP